MSGTDVLLRWPAVQAIGWALLHFVWQGTLVALVAAAVLVASRRAAADVRYLVATIALAVMFTLPVVTGVQVWRDLTAGRANDQAPPTWGSAATVPARPANGQAPSPAVAQDFRPARLASSAEGLRHAIERGTPVLFLAWLLGVSVLSLRLLVGWMWVQRMRTHHVAAGAERWQQVASRLCRRLHITRGVTLLESALVDVPTVIGWVTPVVLLPATALSGLTPRQLEAILAHELAHIRRHDYLVNLVQTAVETLLFYHPAVWWLSRRIRAEREHCCDDLAVSLCGDPIAYAGALADLESLRGSSLALAANGGSLLRRVKRLLGAPASHAGRGPAWLAGGAAIVLVCGIAAVAAEGVKAQPAAASPSAAQATAGTQAPLNLDAALAHTDATLAAVTPMAPRLARAEASLAANAAALAGARTTMQAAAGALVAAAQQAGRDQQESSGNWVWSNNGEKLAASYKGSFDFTDDETDVRQITDGGYLKLSDAALIGRHTVELYGRGGTIERHYYVNGMERAYEPDGHQWLRDNLPRFVRNTGLGADRRVARLLNAGGAAAVLAEISQIESSYVKGIYFTQLMKQATMTPDQYRQVMAQASREMTSDYELAQLLIAAADRLPSDDVSRAAYFSAAAKISSDYELHRVYSTMLKKGPVSSATLADVLSNTKTIGSDYELSQLLQQIVSQQPLDDRTRPLFFQAAASIGSGYEHHRVLNAAILGGDAANVTAALAQARTLGDYERSQLLKAVAEKAGVEGSQRAPFFDAVQGMGSYERGQVLQMVVRRPDASHDTLLAAIRATKGMGGYELSQVLQATARAHALTGDLRDAYIDAADTLGGYEQGQVMTALVKGERRK